MVKMSYPMTQHRWIKLFLVLLSEVQCVSIIYNCMDEVHKKAVVDNNITAPSMSCKSMLQSYWTHTRLNP
jgi:uncharacterized membrane protein